MASARIVDLCQAVAAELNATTFSQTFTAEFGYAPNYSNMDAKTLRVVVTDAGGQIESVSRGWLGFTDSVRVVVLWRVDAGTTGIDTVRMADALLLLEEIVTFLAMRNLADYAPTGTMERATGDKDKTHYMPGNLEDRLFAASVRVEYQTRVNIREGFSS